MRILGALLCVAVVAAGCGGEPREPARSRAAPVSPIAISGFAFEPPRVQVETGEAIIWTNEDDIAHTVTSGRAKKQGVPGVSENRDAAPDGLFDSGTMELNDTFEFTFDEPGTYMYFCAIHAGMSARIVVS